MSQSGENKTLERGQSLSAMVATLKEPQDDSDDGNDDNMDNDGPLFDLFDSLYSSPNASGMVAYSINELCLTQNVC